MGRGPMVKIEVAAFNLIYIKSFTYSDLISLIIVIIGNIGYTPPLLRSMPVIHLLIGTM